MQFYQRQLQHMFFFFGVARALFKPNINIGDQSKFKKGDVLDSIDWLMEAKSPILLLDVSDQASSMCKIRETHG